MKVKTKRKEYMHLIDATPPLTPDDSFRLLVCGSRDWTDADSINLHVQRQIVSSGKRAHQILIIQGGAFGADAIARELCEREWGYACATFYAPWEFFAKLNNKRKAGPMRNFWMLKWGQPHFVLAFHPYLPGSRGTKNMVTQARDAGIPVKVVDK